MLKKYNNYLNENNTENYDVKCKINKKYLLEISGQDNILDALNNELNWTETITIKNIEEIDEENYIITIDVNSKIINDTDTHDMIEAIFYEFSWLDESGIFIKKVE